ncbi:MAG: hypothetical protein ACON44_09530 [Candidatus Puniceispirillaceae bacterium]
MSHFTSFQPFAIEPLSDAERASHYPYQAPETAFVIDAGQCRPLGEADYEALSDRTALLSVGSNRAPAQLLRKFGNEAVLYVTPARLHDCDIIHSACFSYYGAVPCSAYPVKGTSIMLNAVWLTPAQLAIMHDTEAVGTAYDFCGWHKDVVKLDAPIQPQRIYGYATRLGTFCDEAHHPFALSALSAKGRRLTALSQLQARQLLYQRLPAELQRANLDAFMSQLLADKIFRREVNQHLAMSAMPIPDGPWDILPATTDKADQFL